MVNDGIIDAFKSRVEESPQRLALQVGLDNFSYRELAMKVDNLSFNLAALGLNRGDHVAVLLPNCSEFVLMMLAAAQLGLVLVPNTTSLPVTEYKRSFQAADVKHLVAWHGLLSDLKDYFYNDSSKTTKSVIISVGKEISGCENFAALTQEKVLQQVDIAPDNDGDIRKSPYILTMTSGSTGSPKPIVLSQDCKLKRAMAAADLYGVTAEDKVLAATPLYHSLAQRLVLLPLLMGGTSIVLPGFSAKNWVQVVSNSRITFTIAVSSQLKQILGYLDTNKSDVSSLRCLVSSSERIADNLKEQLLSVLSCEFHECYGASEVAIVSDLNVKSAPNKLSSVGKPLSDVNVIILGKDNSVLPAGEVGEIACATPMAFSGYYRNEEQTSACAYYLDNSNGLRFFRTGDLGSLDSDGYLYFNGRLKEIIISGGINIYPKDVEDAIRTHSAVDEVVVVALPDDRFGEKVVAVIQLKPNVSQARELQRSIQKHCMCQLADFQQPQQIIFVDELKRNAMGKLVRRVVAEQLDHGDGYPDKAREAVSNGIQSERNATAR